MLLPRLLATATLLAAATALKDASPFFLLSSKQMENTPLQSNQVALAVELETDVLALLNECPATHYLFVHADNLTISALQNNAMPHISKRVINAPAGAKVEIPQLLGVLDTDVMQWRIADSCGEHTQQNFAGLKDKEVDAALKGYDHKQESWLLIFTSRAPPSTRSRQEDSLYEMDDPYPSASMHQDLKRAAPEVARRLARRQDNSTGPNEGLALFEKYQYFTPAIFMGLTVSILLFVILYTGVSVIAGLQVSYMAFSKEMGPAAQKGKQQ